jgi:5-methylcytosine-specific restriction enzyme subunit McrC
MKNEIGMMEPLPENITLAEHTNRLVVLEQADLKHIAALKFQVSFAEVQGCNEAEEQVTCLVNPGSLVGHFQLPSHRIVVIEPKVDAASIFRMLAYVFTDNHRRLLRDEQVNYATDRLLFEPLVELFNALVNARARRGLARDYIRREENLGVLRGALNIDAHVQHNFGRENQIYCRFFEQTVDIPDNRLVKTTLHHLLQFGGWTRSTTQALVRNLHQFDAVSLERHRPQTAPNGHYHRLNDDYRPIHELCRLFLACSSLSERVGTFGFRGFLLDLNLLFEQFVEKAFQTAVKQSRFSSMIQDERPLSLNKGAPNIKPDITVRRGTQVAIVVDAKYKKDEGGPQNPDIYQVIAYGTVLQCPDVYLLYPKTEIDSERDIPILNSEILVKTRRVDISSPQAVENAEALAEAIVTERQLLAPDLKMA